MNLPYICFVAMTVTNCRLRFEVISQRMGLYTRLRRAKEAKGPKTFAV